MPIWVAGIGAAGSLIGGAMASNAAGDAAGAGVAASENAGKLANAQYWQNRTDALRAQRAANAKSLPYEMAGYGALGALQYGLGIGDPTQPVIKNKETFDPKKYMDWLSDPTKMQGYEAMTDEKKKELEGLAQQWKANAEKIGAWDQYQLMLKAGRETDDGGFWKTPSDAGISDEQLYGKNGLYGFGGYGSLVKKFGLQDFEQEPGYEFRRKEGNRGIESSAAARGGLQSGAALKALNRFNQDYASNEYGNAYNRFTNDQGNIFNRLSGVAGTGQTQTNQMINQSANTQGAIQNMSAANQQAQTNALMSAANARMSGYAGQSKAWGNALSGVTGAAQGYLANM